MKKQSRDWIKAGNYIIVKLPKTKWRIGYISMIGNNEIYINVQLERFITNSYITVPLSSPNIKPLSNIMLTSYEDQQLLMYNLISKCALLDYRRENWYRKYRSEPKYNLAKTLKFNLVDQRNIKIDENIIYKDLGNIISSYVPQYTLTNIVDSNEYIDENSEVKYDAIAIDEFIFNQSLAPFNNLLDQMHNKFVEYNILVEKSRNIFVE